MKRSTDRILTTHVGSLARPDGQLKLLFAKERGEQYDQAEFESSTRQAVDDIVAGQVKSGIDIVCDGEQGKSSFLTYITERLAGFSPSEVQGENLWVDSRESLAFPEFYEAHRKAREGLIAQPVTLKCTAPVEYVGHEILQREIANIKAAAEKHGVEEAFMTAVSPSDVEGQQANEFYDSDEAYLYAIADAMHHEYKAIVDSGLILQIDDPRLLTYYISRPDLTHRRLPQLGPATRRSTQPRAAGSANRPRAIPYLLRNQHRPARPRNESLGHRRHHAEGRCGCLPV